MQFTKKQLTRLKAVNSQLNAVAVFLDQQAIDAAAASTERYKLGTPLSALDGILFTVKDITSSKCRGVKLTNGSAIPEVAEIPDESQAHIDLMLRAGAILLCSTTTPEIGFKATTNSIAFGVTKNVRNTLLTSGGSSGGAATLCAAGIANLNFGSDGGGSIR